MRLADVTTQSIKESLGKDGFRPEIRNLEFFQDDYGLEAGDTSDSETEDDFEEIDVEDINGFDDGVESQDE